MFNFDFWILWINARNLLYIKKFNPRKWIRLADNKHHTKEFLSQRWIPVPQTLWLIKSRQELYDFDFSKLDTKDFVIKPNKWSKWKWILITKFLDNIDWMWDKVIFDRNFINDFLNFWYKSKFPQHHYKIWGKIYDDDYLRRFLTDILDAKYSLTVWNDKILIEEKLIPWSGFKWFCTHGLADIRVIVFNLVPVAAMVRVPTEMSWGKANLAQWGVWLWIEVGSWKIKTMLYKKRVFSNQFPWAYEDFYNKKIPFWNDILLYSSRIQYFVNLWYLALDWVITKDGPKLLEMNARAWLELQNASLLNLKKRLNKVGDIKITDPEKWVEISKTLFNKTKNSIDVVSKIVYLSQKWNVVSNDGEVEIKDIVVNIDLSRNKNYISANLFEKIKDKPIVLDLFETELSFKDIILKPSSKIWNYEIILWKELLSDYYIKPINKLVSSVNIIAPGKIIESEIESLHLLDQKISFISRELNLSSYLKPSNYLDELDQFVAHKWNYNPIFKYKWPRNDKLSQLEKSLDDMRWKYFWQFRLKSPMSRIFEDKIEELSNKLNLLKSYKKQDFESISKYNLLLYWQFDDELLSLSKIKLQKFSSINQDLLWSILSIKDAKNYIENYLEQKDISWVSVVINYSNISRISVQRARNIKINISSNAKFRELELKSILAHEIDSHLVRYLNWLKTGWNIFKSGTTWYLKDEEWLAVYKSFQLLPDWYEKNAMYKKYVFLNNLSNKNFIQTKDLIYDIGNTARTYNWLFKSALRFTQWIENTSLIWNCFYIKDKIYLEWYFKIKNWIEAWGDMNKLLIWKIKIEDIDLFI